MFNPIKVLIVDDASFMVKALKDILESDPHVSVVGSARNGKEALSLINELKPDVVTLDVDMPVMDGIKAIRHIMIESPVPIVMLSSLFSHGDITFEALRLGVVDFLPKPSGAISRDIHEQGNRIIQRVKIAASEKLENVHRVKLSRIDIRDQLVQRYGYNELEQVIAIGTTLGGPNTIIRLMSELSPNLPSAIVATQEITPNIIPEFVKKFNDYTPWKIEVAKEGTVLDAGTCYLSSYQDPFVIQANERNEACLVKASGSGAPLDELYRSAAEVFERNALAVLLTGTGSEGSQGMADIKKKGGVTIAQNSETCVYPNLTRCAIESNVVDLVVDESELCQKIEAVVALRGSGLGAQAV